MRMRGFKYIVLFIGCILVVFAALFGRTVRNEMRQQKTNRALITAIKAADAQTVRSLLDRGADPDACERPPQSTSLWRFLRDRLRGRNGAHSGTPALALAVTGVHPPYEDKAGYARGVAIVKALLDHGAHMDIKNAEGADLINLAVDSDYDEQILRLLLQHLGNVSHRVGKDQSSLLDRKNPIHGQTPLQRAAAWGSPEAIDLLLRAGAKVDLQNDQGQTALMEAIEKGRPEDIACLLKYHPNVLLKDKNGNTALSLARTNQAENVTTSFNHEAEEDFWPNIVQMLEQALNPTLVRAESSKRTAIVAPPKRGASNLLGKARKVTSTENWDLPRGMMNPQRYMTYHWLSRDRLLYLSEGKQYDDLLCLENLRTGEKTTFPTVSKMWSEDGTYKRWIEISPDGQWILWKGDFYDSDYHGYYEARRDGSAKFNVSRSGFPSYSSVQWMPDSRHFIEETGRYVKNYEFKPLTMVMRSVDAPHVTQTLSRKEAAIYSGWYAGWTTHILPGRHVLRIKASNDAFPPRKYVLEKYAMVSRPKLLNRWTISIPPTEERSEMQPSPDGRRIAWIVITPADDHEAQRVALCSSSSDGSALQEIGHILSPAAEASEPPFERYPNEMKWLPDGKHLSFIYKNTLYVLSVLLKAGEGSR